MKKKIISIVLMLSMLVSMLAPMHVSASENGYLPEMSFATDIVVEEYECGTETDKEGNEYTRYYWETLGNYTVVVNDPENGLENHEYEAKNRAIIDIGYRYFMHSEWDMEFVDDQDKNHWTPGNTYDAQIIIYSFYKGDEYVETIDVRVRIRTTNLESITAQDYTWTPFTPKNPTFTVTYKDGISTNDVSGLDICYEDEWPIYPGTYELAMSALSGRYEFTIKVTVLDIPGIDNLVITKGGTVTNEDICLALDENERLYGYYQWSDVVIDATIFEEEYTDVALWDAFDIYATKMSEEGMDVWFEEYYVQSPEIVWKGGQTEEAICLMYASNPETGDVSNAKAIKIPVYVDSDVDLGKCGIVSATAAPVEYYENSDDICPEITLTLENGLTTTDFVMIDGGTEWPTEPGKHTVTVSLFEGQITTTVEVTVLKTPTSGTWAEGITWEYDTETKTLYVKGQGTLTAPAQRINGITVENIVIDEGFTTVAEGAIPFFTDYLESLVFPKSLESLPYHSVFESEYFGDIGSVVFQNGITELMGYPFGSGEHVYIHYLYLPESIEMLDRYSIVASCGGEGLERINYAGTEEQWNSITVDFVSLSNKYTTQILKVLNATYDYPARANLYNSTYQDYIMSGYWMFELNFSKVYTLGVTWYDEEGNIVHYEDVEVGGNANETPDVPAKEGFDGKWDKEATNVRGNMAIYPIYTEKEAIGITVNPVGDVEYSVDGDKITVKSELSCKAGYIDNGKYITVTAIENEDGTCTFTVPEGVTEIEIVVKGDVSGDGKLDESDLSGLMKHINFSDYEISNFASDVNGDGKINNKDYGILQRYLNGWDIEIQ